MKKWFSCLLLAMGVLMVGCSTTKLPRTHPLRHSDLEVLTRPSGFWQEGWLYYPDVMEYLAGTPEERQRATELLESAGFARGKTDYMYVSRSGFFAVDNQVFDSREKAFDFIRRENLTRVLYCDSRIFPKKLPEGFQLEGVTFWLQCGQK